MSIASALFTVVNLSACIMTAACNGSPVQEELLQTALMLPWEDITNYMSLNKCKVEDYNGDGVPEVYLAGASGWGYAVYYWLDGELRTVEGLEPWAWSSDLCVTADGHLVLYTWPHTMGTDGIYNHRIYEWTQDGYRLEEDLWSEPDEWDWDGGTVLSCTYFYATEAADPFQDMETNAEKIPLTKEEYEQKISGLGEMNSVFEGGMEWGWDFWQENDYEDEAVLDGIYRQIQEEILSLQ